MNLWLKIVPNFTLIEILFHLITPKNLIFSHISVYIIQHPLSSIILKTTLIKIFILTLLPSMIIFQLNNFNRTLLLNMLLYPNLALTFLLRIKTFLISLFHVIILMIPFTLLTQTLKCSIFLSIILLPFQKHFLVLLNCLNVYLNLPPITKLHILIFELLCLYIIKAHFLLKTITPRKLLLVSPLKVFSLSLIEFIVRHCHCILYDLSLSLV